MANTQGLGNTIGTAAGTAAFGPLGGLAGGVIGGLAGGLFGSKKKTVNLVKPKTINQFQGPLGTATSTGFNFSQDPTRQTAIDAANQKFVGSVNAFDPTTINQTAPSQLATNLAGQGLTGSLQSLAGRQDINAQSGNANLANANLSGLLNNGLAIDPARLNAFRDAFIQARSPTLENSLTNQQNALNASQGAKGTVGSSGSLLANQLFQESANRQRNSLQNQGIVGSENLANQALNQDLARLGAFNNVGQQGFNNQLAAGAQNFGQDINSATLQNNLAQQDFINKNGLNTQGFNRNLTGLNAFSGLSQNDIANQLAAQQGTTQTLFNSQANQINLANAINAANLGNVNQQNAASQQQFGNIVGGIGAGANFGKDIASIFGGPSRTQSGGTSGTQSTTSPQTGNFTFATGNAFNTNQLGGGGFSGNPRNPFNSPLLK